MGVPGICQFHGFALGAVSTRARLGKDSVYVMGVPGVCQFHGFALRAVRDRGHSDDGTKPLERD